MSLPEPNSNNLLDRFRDFLKEKGYSTPTVKNYISDLRHLIFWLEQNSEKFHISTLSEKSLEKYRSFLKTTFQEKPSIAARRLSSLRKFLAWAFKNGLVTADLLGRLQKALEEPPTLPTTSFEQKASAFFSPANQISASNLQQQPTERENDLTNLRLHKRIFHHLRFSRPGWYQTYHQKDFAHTLHLLILVLYLLGVGSLVFYSQFVKPQLELTRDDLSNQLGGVLAAVSPPRILSFQGRLTDSNDVPVSSATDVVFRIYTSTSGDTGSPCASTCLWESKTWTVTPDQNGIFSVLLGDTSQSDTAIPATLFSDNDALYLGVKVESDSEMTPRQRIAASSYALNSDTLDGVDSLSFLRSDTDDSFTSGTLTVSDGTTLTVNSTSIGLGNASSDSLTVNSASSFTTDVDLVFAGTENLAATSDLAGTVNVFSIVGTPSGTAGTTQGLFIQQANHASNTNGLDVGIKIDNADADLAITDAISITNTGGGGTPYTNLFNSPTLDISGAGAITGATGITSSGAITFSDLITDANAVLYTTTGGVVTRVAETETRSQCLLSGSGASGTPSWGSCPGGSQTPWTTDIDADGFDLTDISNVEFRETTGAPAGSSVAIFRDNSGDLNLNSLTGKSTNIQVNGADQFGFSSTGVDVLKSGFTTTGLANSAVTLSGTITSSSATRSFWMNQFTSEIDISANPGGFGSFGISVAAHDLNLISTDFTSGSALTYDAQPTIDLQSSGSQTFNSLINFRSNVSTIRSGASGTLTVNEYIGFYMHQGSIAANTTVTNSYGLKVDNASVAGTLTTQYGVYVASLTSGGTNYGVYVAGSNDYGVYSVANSTDNVAIYGSGAWQGNVVTTTTSDSGTTSTITTPALAYYVESSDSSGTCATGSKTFNITGLPSAEGAHAFIVSKATDAGCTSSTLTVTVQIDGSTISTVANANTGGTVTENYTVAYVNGSWRIVSGTTTGDTADLAEWFEYTGERPAPGEIVSTSSSPEKITKTENSYDEGLIGIVSTQPHTTLGKETEDSVPVALAGRVPTKVSTENGPIAIGDPLTSSSVPGVAMKATRSGPILGKALVAYSSSDTTKVDSIIVFVNVGWYISPLPGIDTANANFSKINTQNFTAEAAAIDRLIIGNPQPSSATEISTETMELLNGGSASAISDHARTTWLDPGGKIVAWVTDQGEGFFKKVTALVGDFRKIIFGELAVAKDSDVAGQAEFEQNQEEVFIESEKVAENSLINLTPTTKTDGLSLYIKEIKPGEGFVVALERSVGDLPTDATASAKQTIKFNWLIINREN